MYDYVADYVAKKEAQVFWSDVYDVMRSKSFSEEQALKLLDSKGTKRVKYPRPEDFPNCFAEDA